eukprot:TRINITY_DN4518_c0_g1_i1.p1 TRINITY_DN4518_c0_g1~~TRINITY_DN4518_c0_g1_i1.p1  ORF type:complete len:254 (-),score=41.00 TRINITY_DN4518_c0_g1_i1:17-670(-)
MKNIAICLGLILMLSISTCSGVIEDPCGDRSEGDSCFNGDSCTISECMIMDSGLICVDIGPVNCTDFNECTIDFCGSEGCYHIDADCSDEDSCTVDSCDIFLGCLHENNCTTTTAAPRRSSSSSSSSRRSSSSSSIRRTSTTVVTTGVPSVSDPETDAPATERPVTDPPTPSDDETQDIQNGLNNPSDGKTAAKVKSSASKSIGSLVAIFIVYISVM